MGRWIRSSLARCLAVLVARLLVLGMMAAIVPASAAWSLSRESGGRLSADAARLAAGPASLRAAIRTSLGTSALAAGYSQQAELTASGGAAGDGFGDSVALSARGTTALVGADFHHSNAGAVYVFTLRGGTWSQTAELTASHGAHGDHFGELVALSAQGTTALVAAPGRNRGAGAVYVFTLRGGIWSRTGELTASHGAQGDAFGLSVALSAPGTTALVGAPFHNAGAAYVFRLRGGTWSQTGELTATHEAQGDWFGWSVALSPAGSRALVGAPFHNAGAVYVFRVRGGIWSQIGELTATHGARGDGFGDWVALSASGTTALVGADFHHSNAGAVYVFTPRGGTWSQTAELTASHGARGDHFGGSVALSAQGGTALVGSAGAAYVFTLRGGTWSQTAELTASHGAQGGFGASVALSAQGTTALIGAPRVSGTEAAYVFIRDGRT